MPKLYETPAALLGQEGTRLGPSGWLTIEQKRIDLFAEATDDHQWIHVDIERARTGPFGATIAHGYLTLSLVSRLLPELIEIRGFSHGVNIGADRVRFIAPVPAGSRLRAIGEIVAVEAIKGAVQLVVRVTLELDGSDRPACVVDTIGRYFPE